MEGKLLISEENYFKVIYLFICGSDEVILINMLVEKLDVKVFFIMDMLWKLVVKNYFEY